MKQLLWALCLILSSFNADAYMKYELYCNADLLEKSRKIALSQNGVIEKCRNSGEVSKYLRVFNTRSGTPYCAAGIYWCFYEAAYSLDMPLDSIPLPKTLLANNLYFYAKKYGTGANYAANIDDLIIWRNKYNIHGHVERIIKVGEKGNVTTIAFNSSAIINGEKKEGVFIKQRNIYHPLSNLVIRGLVGFKSNIS